MPLQVIAPKGLEEKDGWPALQNAILEIFSAPQETDAHTSKTFNPASPSKPSTSHPMSPSSQINLLNQTPKGKGKLSIMPQPGPSWKMPNPVTPKNEQCTISNNSSLWGDYSIGEDMLEEISNQLSKLESNSTIHSMSSA